MVTSRGRPVRRVLVTGGAGFVGSHVVDELIRRDMEVVVLDALRPDVHDGPPDYLNPAAEYVVGDVRDVEAVEGCLRGVGAVSHQAAMVGLGVGFADTQAYVSHNDAGTATLLVAMHRVGFGGRLVLAGSMVVYGEGAYGCRRHGPVRPGPRDPKAMAAGRFEPACPACGRPLSPRPVTEDAPADPRNVYAATKLHQEHLCAAFGAETGVPVTTLRYHNVYGPRMPADSPYSGVAAVFRSALAAGRPPEVFEDGRQLRDFVHVRDVAEANVRALLADRAEPGAFNVASGDPRTVGEVAAALCSLAGPDLEPVVSGRFRTGDVRHVFASVERAEERLGFRARIGFGAGMAELVTAPLRAARAARAAWTERAAAGAQT